MPAILVALFAVFVVVMIPLMVLLIMIPVVVLVIVLPVVVLMFMVVVTVVLVLVLVVVMPVLAPPAFTALTPPSEPTPALRGTVTLPVRRPGRTAHPGTWPRPTDTWSGSLLSRTAAVHPRTARSCLHPLRQPLHMALHLLQLPRQPPYHFA